MSIKYKILRIVTRLFSALIFLTGRTNSAFIKSFLAQELAPIYKVDIEHGAIKFFCPGTLPLNRARTLLTKEPETIDWINSIKKDEVLWDIGANIGIYSLFAASKKISTYSFEPFPGNYYLLSKNIEINEYSNYISAFCIAFSEKTGIDEFYMEDTGLGTAEHSFSVQTDWRGEEKQYKNSQKVIGFSIDDFIQYFHPEFPNHLKIDVDGIEDSVLFGAKKTLNDKRLKSILIELDVSRAGYYEGVKQFLADSGFTLTSKRHAPIYDESEYSDVYNHVFSKK